MKQILYSIKNNKLFSLNRSIVKKPILFSVFGLLLMLLFMTCANFFSMIVISFINNSFAIGGVPIFQTGIGKLFSELFFTFGFGILLLLLYVKFIEKASFESLGLGKNKAFKKFLKGFFIGFVLMTTTCVILLLTNSAKVVSVNFSLKGLLLTLLILPAWLVQSSSEELLTRGYYMNRLGGHKPFLAIIVSSLVFAMAHLLNPNISYIAVLNITLYALFAALYVIFTEDIIGACGIHTAWNFFQGSVYGFNVSGMGTNLEPIFSIETSQQASWFSGGSFGPEGGILTSIMYILAIIILCYQKKRSMISDDSQ